MKRLLHIITFLVFLSCFSFNAKSITFSMPPVNCDSLSGYISMSIDSGTCYKRDISVRLYNNLLNFHHWERSYDGTTFTNISTNSILTQSNVTDRFWVRAVVKTGSDSCYTNVAFYNEVCAYDTIRIDTMYNAALSGHPTYKTYNFKNHEDIYSKCWTISGQQDPGRTLLRIDYTSIPKKSIIKKSTIYLYSDLKSDRIHSSLSRTNESYFHRIDTAWNLNTVTWMTQPNNICKTDSVILPQIAPTTTTASFDITNFTKYWCANPTLNYGMRMIIKTELAYCRQSYFSRNTIGADSVKRPYVMIVCYKPQIFVDTKGYNTNGDSIFIKAEVGSYRKTFYSGIKQNVILDSISTYPGNLLLKVFKKGVASDTTSLQLTVDSAFRINAVKVLKDGSYTNYSPDNYFAFDNKITFYSENLKKDNFSSTYKLNLKNGLKMILFPNGNPSGNDTIWSKLYVVGSIPTNSRVCLIIYDSFNNVIYKTFSPTNQWDGKINNILIPESSYKYTLYINDLIYRGQFFVEYKN